MNSLILLYLLCIGSGFILAHETSTSVVDLTPDNFDSVLDASKHAFVMFYAPWCGHCKKLAPDWSSLGDAFVGSKEKVVIAKVDADAHKELGNRFDVHGYPTLKWFPKGSTSPEDYEGERDLDAFVAFVSSKSGEKSKIKKPVSAVVDLTSANFDKIVLDSNKHVLVEFFAPWCGHCKRLAPEYEIVATAFATESSVVVAKIDADKYTDIGTKYGVGAFPTLIWFPKDDKSGGAIYQGPRDVESIVGHINTHAGTARDKNGQLSDEAGRVDQLDEIAEKWATGDKVSLLKEAEEIVATLAAELQQDAKYYVKVMTTSQETSDFITSELARLERMISSGSLNPKKKDEFTKKKNVLSVFSEI